MGESSRKGIALWCHNRRLDDVDSAAEDDLVEAVRGLGIPVLIRNRVFSPSRGCKPVGQPSRWLAEQFPRLGYPTVNNLDKEQNVEQAK